MEIKKVLESCIYGENLDEMEAFYTQVLGLKIYSKVAGRHLFFRIGNGMFLIFNPKTTLQSGSSLPPHGTSGTGHLAFDVPEADIANWRKQLMKKNIEIEAEITWPNGGLSLYFRDPANNSIEITSGRIWGISEI